jgi:hypothetical protein
MGRVIGDHKGLLMNGDREFLFHVDVISERLCPLQCFHLVRRSILCCPYHESNFFLSRTPVRSIPYHYGRNGELGKPQVTINEIWFAWRVSSERRITRVTRYYLQISCYDDRKNACQA